MGVTALWDIKLWDTKLWDNGSYGITEVMGLILKWIVVQFIRINVRPS